MRAAPATDDPSDATTPESAPSQMNSMSPLAVHAAAALTSTSAQSCRSRLRSQIRRARDRLDCRQPRSRIALLVYNDARPMFAPQSMMRGAGSVVSNASAWTDEDVVPLRPRGHRVAYASEYGDTTISPGVRLGSVWPARSSSCRTACSGVGQEIALHVAREPPDCVRRQPCYARTAGGCRRGGRRRRGRLAFTTSGCFSVLQQRHRAALSIASTPFVPVILIRDLVPSRRRTTALNTLRLRASTGCRFSARSRCSDGTG